jgi:hypothetical protein
MKLAVLYTDFLVSSRDTFAGRREVAVNLPPYRL